jgi:hypothetical protein
MNRAFTPLLLALTLALFPGCMSSKNTGPAGSRVPEPPAPDAITPPHITDSSQSSEAATAGGTVSFEATASDPRGTALTFAWSANIGALGTPDTRATTSRVTWTAPACSATGTSVIISTTRPRGLDEDGRHGRGAPPPHGAAAA